MRWVVFGILVVFGLSTLGLLVAIVNSDGQNLEYRTIKAEVCESNSDSVNPCATRDVSGFRVLSFSVADGLSDDGVARARVEDLLEEGLQLAGASPVQIALRGGGNAASARCEWRGTAARRRD